jgi:hypothetical protein
LCGAKPFLLLNQKKYTLNENYLKHKNAGDLILEFGERDDKPAENRLSSADQLPVSGNEAM